MEQVLLFALRAINFVNEIKSPDGLITPRQIREKISKCDSELRELSDRISTLRSEISWITRGKSIVWRERSEEILKREAGNPRYDDLRTRVKVYDHKVAVSKRLLTEATERYSEISGIRNSWQSRLR